MIVFLIILMFIAVFVYVVVLYNNIIRNRNDVDKAFGTVDAMLKKRYDLLPNLVEVVKQYSLHESSVFTEITSLRAQLTDNKTNDEKVELHNSFARKSSGMFFSVEGYPELKANQNYLRLQAAWNESEEQIVAARRYYNAAVTSYNNSIQSFPANILLDPQKFKAMDVFDISDAERQNVVAKDLF